MWKVMKDLYTNVKAQVLYAGSLSGKINVSQGTGQGRILAFFMYKVYVNGLLCVLTNHCYAMFINGLRIPSPSFADDITLLALHPSSKPSRVFATNMVSNGDTNSIIPRVELLQLVNLSHNTFKPIKNREWLLGNTIADELYEYKNLGVLKNYVGSFSLNFEDNIDKTRKKAGLIFASNFDRRKSILSSG